MYVLCLLSGTLVTHLGETLLKVVGSLLEKLYLCGILYVDANVECSKSFFVFSELSILFH